MPAYLEHLTLEASPTLERSRLCLRIGAVRRILAREEATPLLSKRSEIHCVQLARVRSDVAEQQDRGRSVANAGLAYALTRAVLAFRQAKPSGDPIALHAAVARARSRMSGGGLLLGRDELAARCHVSTTHLSRLFAQELGQSLRDVRNRKRLARFQHLIDAGDCQSLTETALEAGFGSYSPFHRVYRRFSGRSPSGRGE